MSVHEYILVFNDNAKEEEISEAYNNAKDIVTGDWPGLDDFSIKAIRKSDNENPISSSALEPLTDDKHMIAVVKRGPGWARAPWLEASVELIPKLSKDNRYLRTENARLKQDNDALRENVQSIRSKYNKANNDLKDSLTLIEEKNGVLTNMRKEVRKIVESKKTLQSEVKRLREEGDNSDSMLELRNDLEECISENSELKKKLANTERALLRSQEEVEHYKDPKVELRLEYQRRTIVLLRGMIMEALGVFHAKG